MMRFTNYGTHITMSGIYDTFFEKSNELIVTFDLTIYFELFQVVKSVMDRKILSFLPVNY